MGGVAAASSKAFVCVAQALSAAAAAAMVLVWCIHFRGGLAFESTNKSLIFNAHPVLMLIGFIVMASEATMIYRALPWSKKVKKPIHLALHATAHALGAVGISAAFKFHNESGIDNLYSLHSWLGLGTISLYGVQVRSMSICRALSFKLLNSIAKFPLRWILSFVAFFYPGASALRRAAWLPWHALFGIFIYLLAIVSAELGFLEKLTFLEGAGLRRYSAEAFLVNSTALVVILLGGSVVLSHVAPFMESNKVYTAE